MPPIPAWAIGVAAICAGVGVMVVLVQIGEGLARTLFGTGAKQRGPHTVIGMHVGARGTGESGAGESTPRPGALDDLQRRVAELEERLDFAERLLARTSRPEELSRPR